MHRTRYSMETRYIYLILARSQADTLRMNYNKNNKKIAERKKANKEDACTVIINFNIGYNRRKSKDRQGNTRC